MQIVLEPLQDGLAALLAHVEGLGDGGDHQGRVAERGQVDEEHPVWEAMSDER